MEEENDNLDLLHQAAHYNDVQLMESLLLASAHQHINYLDSQGRTPLFVSISEKNIECSHLLLMAGADPNKTCEGNFNGLTPLHVAAENNSKHLVDLLLDYNADVSIVNGDGKQALDMAISTASDLCADAIRNHLDISVLRKQEAKYALKEAFKRGDISVVKNIISSLKLSQQEIKGIIESSKLEDHEHDILYSVCRQGKVEMCELLLELGAELRVEPSSGLSPVHISCLAGSFECLKLLLDKFPQHLYIQTFEESYPLHLACMQGYKNILVLLVVMMLRQIAQENEAQELIIKKTNQLETNDEIQMKKIESPSKKYSEINKTIYDVMLGNFDLSQYLTSRESYETFVAGMNVKDSRGCTALHICVLGGFDTLVEFLLSLSVPQFEGSVDNKKSVMMVDCISEDANTALHMAVMGLGSSLESKMIKIIKLLLKSGSDPNLEMSIINQKAVPVVSRALIEATKVKSSECVKLLLEYGAEDDDHAALKAAIELEDNENIGILIEKIYITDHENCFPSSFLNGETHEMSASKRGASLLDSMSCKREGQRIDWSSFKLSKLCFSWFQKVSFQYYSTIDKFTHTTQDHTNLITHIDLSNNKLPFFNAFFFKMKNLKKLDLSKNKIDAVSFEEVHDCDEGFESQTLFFFSDHFEKIPRNGVKKTSSEPISDVLKTLFAACSIEEINISKNNFASFPKCLLRLGSLKRLNISFNKISTLPEELWTNTNLLEFNASFNSIRTITTSNVLLSCPNKYFEEALLTTESTFEEDLSSESEDSKDSLFQSTEDHSFKPVFDWRHQIKLNLSLLDQESPINDSSDKEFVLCHLKELDLSHNLLEEVPSNFSCLLYNLEKLNLSHNKIINFGAVHSYPPKLQVLDLSHNGIQFFDNLTFFTQSRPLTRPSSASRFSGRMAVSRSYRESFLNEITNERRSSTKAIASTLNFTSNKNSTCKHCLHNQLFKLKTLLLNHNQLNSFEFMCHEDLLNRSSIKDKTNLPKNPPKSIFPNLLTLDLSHNHFTHLIRHIGLLRNLTTLNIANNNIRELPSEIGSLKKLWALSLVGNPVEGVLRSLLGDKMRLVSSLVSYLKAIQDKAVAYNHMKLMMVGKQGVGKTSVINMLTGGKNSKSQRDARKSHLLKSNGHKGSSNHASSTSIAIGDLVLKHVDQEVVFSTWDFGGQKEYYVTQQYFLSKRSIFLLVWRLTDGSEGINEIFKWLINIQARAPGSAVLIVGTHLDQLTTFDSAYLENVCRSIESKYINLEEPERWGFPRVVAHVELCVKKGSYTKQHQSLLKEALWKAVNFSLDKQGIRLIDQKVPVSYIYLQEVLGKLAQDLKKRQLDPVLNTEQYKQMVIEKMEEEYGSSFKDVSELNQATNFLHENGVLLHYEDQNLRHLYFLDPQWMCDVIACVVNPRKINKVAVNGVMRVDDLPMLLQEVAFKTEDLQKFMIKLLHKFEVALQWDHKHLLIPSLLPTDHKDKHYFVMIPTNEDADNFIEDFPTKPLSPLKQPKTPIKSVQSAPNFQKSNEHYSDNLITTSEINNPTITRNPNPALSYFRLYTMSYFPSGFWSRLMTRMLGDPLYTTVLKNLYNLTSLRTHNVDINNLPGSYWHCWQTGLELKYLSLPILRVKEVSASTSPGVFDYHRYHLVLNEENNFMWSSVLNLDASILEIVVFNETFLLKPSNEEHSIVIYPTSETTVRLLTMVVEQIDTLLEDWYPSLGTRFTKDIKGSMLINRLVPCTQCLMQQKDNFKTPIVEGFVKVGPEDYDSAKQESSKGFLFNISPTHSSFRALNIIKERLIGGNEAQTNTHAQHSVIRKPEASFVSFTSHSEAPQKVVYCLSIEQCIQIAQLNKIVSCPKHGNLGPAFAADLSGFAHFLHVAPDTVFYDLNSDMLFSNDFLQKKSFLGKGTFGAVFSGTITRRSTEETEGVALKFLQPMMPEEKIGTEVTRHIKRDICMWNKDPCQSCCEAYTIVRKELSILLHLKHIHVVPLIGISVSPLCLILALAPLGSLNEHLKKYSRYSSKLPLVTIQEVILQVASALKYLHSKQIIYRDLKSENILVWSFPFNNSSPHLRPIPANVKLADYGVSRVVLPSGTKGLAGTLPFMAPEIILQNGEETYTEKVDCYSFALLMYELMTLKFPYEGDPYLGTCKINLKSHVLAGGRPALLLKETIYPTNILELLTTCWSHDPEKRPSAKAIESFASQPEFTRLMNAWSGDVDVQCACIIGGKTTYELLMYGESFTHVPYMQKTHDFYSYTCSEENFVQIKKLPMEAPMVTCMCVVGDAMWCGCRDAWVHIYNEDMTEKDSFKVVEETVSINIITPIHDKLCLLLNDGRIFVCSYCMEENVSDQPDNTEGQNFYAEKQDSKYEMIKTAARATVMKVEHACNSLVHCMLYLETNLGRYLWCGQTQGRIMLWRVGDNRLHRVKTLAHSPSFLSSNYHFQQYSSPSKNINGDWNKDQDFKFHKHQFHNGTKSKSSSTSSTLPNSTSHSSSPSFSTLTFSSSESELFHHTQEIARNNSIVFSPTKSSMPPHPSLPPLPSLCDTVSIVADSIRPSYLFSYVFPGTCVYRWNPLNNLITAFFHFTSLLPEHHGGASQHHISCMAVLNDNLYIGTSLGFFISVNTTTLSPSFVCQPYYHIPACFTSILPLKSSCNHIYGNGFDENFNQSSDNDQAMKRKNSANDLHSEKMNQEGMFVTLGKGYRSLSQKVFNSDNNHIALNTLAKTVSYDSNIKSNRAKYSHYPRFNKDEAHLVTLSDDHKQPNEQFHILTWSDLPF